MIEKGDFIMFYTLREKLSAHSLYPWLIFFSVTTGTLMVNIDSSILNVALPVLEDYFHVGPQTFQWVISGYLLIITGILPIVGKISDLKGRKITFIIGISTFTIGSILSAISGTIYQLIAFRIVQGIGGAIIQGNVMSIIAHAFPQGKRGKALGFIGSIVAIGTIAGPSLGGFILEQYSWRVIFWVNVPIGLVSVIGASILLPASIKKQDEKLDYTGAIVFFIAMISLLLYVSNGQSWGWTSLISWVLLFISITVWIFFFIWERQVQTPLINFDFFNNPIFSVGNIVLYISFILIMIPSILFPLYLHNVRHVDMITIGIIMTGQALAMMVVSPISGWLSDRIGNDWPTIAGMSVISISLFMMGNLSNQSNVGMIILSLVIFGIGMSLFQSPNNVSILESVPVHQTGITGGIIATVRNFGRVSGVAITILLLQLNLTNHFSMQNYTDSVTFVFHAGGFLAFGGLLLLIYRFSIEKRKSNGLLLENK